MLAVISDTGIIVLALAIVLLFGASQLPKMARNLAEAGREFRKAHAELDSATTPVPQPAPSRANNTADLQS